MSILQKLNALKNNVFGGPGSTGPSPPIGRKSAIELAKTNPLIGKLDDDPFAFTSLVYPMSMSDYKQQGHYIIFYINERNTSTYDTAMADNHPASRGRKSSKIAQPKKEIKSVAVFTEEDAAREALRGRYSSPVYDQVKETATVTPGNELSTLDQIAETSAAAAAEAAAATQESFRGRVTGPAAALIDSAAATRPTQADISGDLLSTATAAVTAPARPNIGQMTDRISQSSASAAAATRESFRGTVTATTAAELEERAASTRESFRGAGETATQLAERAAATRESYRGQVPNPDVATSGRPFDMSDVAGPLKRKLKVIDSPGRGHSTGGRGKNNKKKHTVRNSEGTDLSLEKQKSTGGMNSYADLTTRISKSIALYLPPNIESKYAVNYDTAETGTLGFMAATAAGIIGSTREKDESALAKRFVGAGGSLLTSLGLKVGGELASAAGLGEGGAALGAKFFGIASNPYMEVLFDNAAMREFTYSFNFTPKSQKETQEIKDIIETFRTHMAPEVINDNGRYMTLPSEFDIHYMYQDGEGEAKENTYYNKIATCVLTSCNVNYTPNGVVQVHADGSPVSINMQLSFQETEMITKQHIKKGF